MATSEELALLSELYPTKESTATEIINLETILSLPKGTEHFMSDIHGEFAAFNHVLRSCSGVIKRHIGEIFSSADDAQGMSEVEQNDLAALIYYPKEALYRAETIVHKDRTAYEVFLRKQLCSLTAVLQSVASKYTAKYVKRAIPPAHEHMIRELLHYEISPNAGEWTQGRMESNKEHYYNTVVANIVRTGMGEGVVTDVCDLICRLAVYHLHIVGDIYDRGPEAHNIMEKLCNYHSVDIQWGNHDMLWMGAAAGSEVSMCATIRIALRYSNTITLEDAYGIALFPLSQLALHYYDNDKLAAKIFKAKKSKEKVRTEQDNILFAKMQKAIAIIQFKLEAQFIRRHPEYNMDDRLILHNLDTKKGIITIGGKVHKLNDTFFPTIDPKNPEELTPLERSVVDQLMGSFKTSRWLQKHMALLWSHGGMYTVSNNRLLLHGGIPMTSEGVLEEIMMADGVKRSGRAYCDALDALARQGIAQAEGTKERQDGLDMLYYLWTGPKSPLFGKDRMTTFERYFIEDKRTHAEPKDPYLKMRHDSKVAKVVLADFGCCPEVGVVINGHTPVRVAKGESPIKADGKLIVIDGGFSAAYQKETGIAGYTLISNSYGLMLSEHKAFRGREAAVTSHDDNHARTIPVSHNTKRIRNAETDFGRRLQERLVKLNALLKAYNEGTIRPMQARLQAKL